MRISEVVNEGVIDSFKQGFQKGSAGMDRALSPSKWFNKSDSSEKSVQQAEPTADSKESRQVLVKVTTGGVLKNTEIQVLNQIYTDIEASGANPRINQKAVLPILQLAIKGKPLDDNQKAVLTQLTSLV